MSVILSEEIRRALADPGTVRAVSTVGKDGDPHIAFKQSLRLRRDGNLEYDEGIETSQTNKNLVYSIWFGKTVSISLFTPDRRSYNIVGRPLRVLIAGREFRTHYTAAREERGDIDLAAVWVIEPVATCEQSFDKRRVEEEAAHPLLQHLDRLTVTGQ
ncbi:hypothetical protein [Clostridium sp. KNHs216]|uniref:hypothetical protein n=1 Tax=Clostridium sp. KNHs216 TaxID=1550235 RepID=UPI0011543E62|nr:hypothetical protein [Clostridium sp. KNHs216]TQI68529.1 hypothetical protein LY85_3268 [Clostridium sp. KNHs216]